MSPALNPNMSQNATALLTAKHNPLIEAHKLQPWLCALISVHDACAVGGKGVNWLLCSVIELQSGCGHS